MNEPSASVSFTDSQQRGARGVEAPSSTTPVEGQDPLKAPRFKDATSFLGAYRAAAREDEASAKNRALVQAMVDGKPPFNPMALKAAGRPNDTNINFLEGAALADSTASSYNALIDGVDELVRVKMKPGVYDPTVAFEYGSAIAEEMSTLIRDDPDFSFNWEYISRQIATHGVAIAFCPHDEGVDYKVGGLDDFVIPRQSKATEEALDCLFALRRTSVDEIWTAIQDAKVARNLGWNVGVAERALVKACGGSGTAEGHTTEWAALQARLKNNDLGESFVAKGIDVIHGWVREKDGRISHYMALLHGEGGNAFLFEKRNRFAQATDAFVIFIANIGSNGTYHSVRGAAYRAYSVICESNKLRSTMIDGTKMAMTTLIQPTDSESIEDLTILVNGATSYLPPDAKVVDRGSFMSPAQHALPVVNDLSQLLAGTTGMFKPRPISTEGPEKSRLEVQASIETQSVLTTSSVNVFYRAVDRFVNMLFRRVQRLDPENLAVTGRHPRVLEFYNRLAARGVPAEAVQSVHKLTPVKAIGLGSPTQRIAAISAIGAMAGSFDPVGRRTFDRMALAAHVGHDMVDALLPKNPAPRVTTDDKFANLEHAALHFRDVAVDPSELHQTHLGIHFPIVDNDLKTLSGALDEGAIESEEAIEEVQYLQRALQHIQSHIEQERQDPRKVEEVAQYDDAFGQLAGAWERLANEVQSGIADKQAAEGANMDPKMAAKMQEHQFNLQRLQDLHQQRMQQKEEDHQQRMRLRAIQTDVRLSGQIRQATLKASGPTAAAKRA